MEVHDKHNDIEDDVVGLKLLSLAELKEIDEFLQRKLGTFDGERVDTLSRFVGLFESVCESRGWNGLSQEILVELLTGLLVGKAQTAWHEWSRDEPDMMVSYNRLKNELPHKLGNKVNLWKQISDFHNMRMTKEVTVFDYADTYL